MASEPNPEPARRLDAEEAEASTRMWQEFLSSELRCPVRVVYTRARRTPLQVRPVERARAPAARASAPESRGQASDARGPSHDPRARLEGSARPNRRGARAPRTAGDHPGASGLEVRMHSMFVAAPPHVHEAVVRWIRSGRRAPRACALLDRWIMESLERLPTDAPRDVSLRARGQHHDLEALTDGLLASEFAAEHPARLARPRVTWGRKGQSRTRHSLRLGSFDPEGAIVRIHPVLDQAAVPVWFVRYVLFHEILHAALPPQPGQGSRWIHHGADFRRRERAYVDYARAIAWEKAHMTELIRSARRTTPMRATASDVLESPASAREKPAKRAPAPKPEARTGLVRLVQAWLFPE